MPEEGARVQPKERYICHPSETCRKKMFRWPIRIRARFKHLPSHGTCHPPQKCTLRKQCSLFLPTLPHVPDSIGIRSRKMWTTSLEKQLNTEPLLNHKTFFPATIPKWEETPQLKIKLVVLIIIWDCALQLLIWVCILCVVTKSDQKSQGTA